MDRIVVIGAGAMGCLFAARLARAGKIVTLVDVDESRLSHIAESGIELRDETGLTTVAVNVASARDAPTADLVLLFTKAMHSRIAIASVSHLADGNCCALTLQNGLGNAEAIAQIFEPDHTLLGVTDWPADHSAPNAVTAHGSGRIWLGGMTASCTEHASKVVSALNAAGLNAQHDGNVHSAVWEKAAFNAALNAMSTILNVPVGGLDSPDGRSIANAVIDETIAVAVALDIKLDRARLLAKTDFALANHRAHKPSMLQDRLAGRLTEIDSINGQIVAAAKRANVATPVTETLASLVRMGEPGRK
ncbi:MAG: ketopantoate reductase family protein [Novosphingobium sp.]